MALKVCPPHPINQKYKNIIGQLIDYENNDCSPNRDAENVRCIVETCIIFLFLLSVLYLYVMLRLHCLNTRDSSDVYNLDPLFMETENAFSFHLHFALFTLFHTVYCTEI